MDEIERLLAQMPPGWGKNNQQGGDPEIESLLAKMPEGWTPAKPAAMKPFYPEPIPADTPGFVETDTGPLPAEFAGFGMRPNTSDMVPTGDAAPGVMSDVGRAVKSVMDPVFEYGVAPFMGGAISGTTRFADAAGYLADKIGADTIRDKMFQIGKAGGQLGADLTRETAPEDLGAIGQFIRATAGAAGSSLPSLALGMAAAPAQGASWASNTAMALHGGSDALGEAGDTMREVLANGGSIEEARSAANKVAVANLLYNAIAEPLAGPFSGWGEAIPGLRGHLMRGAVRGGEEMIQETLQDMWSAAAQKRREDGQPVTYGDVLGNFLTEGKNLPAYLQESGAPAFLSSFLMGAGMPYVADTAAQAPAAGADTSAPVAEVLEELRKEQDAASAIPPQQRAELQRWAQAELDRMGEAARFVEDESEAVNPLSEADLVKYQALRDSLKTKDFETLAEMRRTEEAQSNLLQSVTSDNGTEHGDADFATIDTSVNSKVNRVIGLPKGYTMESGRPFSEAAPEDFVLRNGERAWGHVTEELSGGREDVPIGEVRVQAGDKEWGLNHAKVHEHRAQKIGFQTMEDFIANGLENGNSVIPIGDSKHFLVARVEGNKVHPSAVIRWNPDDGFYSLTTSFPATDRDIRRQEDKSRSLRSGPPAPEPAPASLASNAPLSDPERGVDWRNENHDSTVNIASASGPVNPSSYTMRNGARIDFAPDGGATLTLPNEARTIKEFGSRNEMKEWMGKFYPGGLRDLQQWEARQIGAPSGPTDPEYDPTVFDIDESTIQGLPDDDGDFEGYEQRGAGSARTAPPQTKDSGRTRTKEELDRLGRDIEARMIAAGRPVEEAKAMGLLASEFAGRFAERTNTRPEDALNVQFKRSNWDETKGGEGFDQIASRQSPDYDSSDPKTWPPSAERDEAIQLDAWLSFEPEGDVVDWPDSPEKTEALALQEEREAILAWIDNLPPGESVRRIFNNDPEWAQKTGREDEILKRLSALGRALQKKKPKNAKRRFVQLIDAEEAAAARELGDEYYQERPETTENIRRGQAAMEKVIAEQTDVMDAMHRDDLGSISFLWGEPGRGDRFKGGWGVSHLIAHRNAQGYDGEAVARKMVEVVAKGALDKTDRIEKGSRAYLKHDGYTAVMSLYRDGERQTWLLTGWEDYKEKAPGEIGSVYDDLNPTLSEATRFHPEEGAGASAKSKPPRAQKSKSKTAPNARTYFLPDGTSVIEFFETANKSTSFHEFGHHIFNKMLEFSGKEGVDPQMAEDVKTILKAAGVTREAFDANKKNARRRAHEFFARGFEKYLGEGKAPTKALRDVFRRIHNWMIEVYHKIANIPGKQLSDEMRVVYDRLFASDGAFGDIYGAEDVRSGEKIPDGMVRTERKSGITVDKKARDTSNDTRMMDLFNSPNVVARRHAKFRPFFSLGKEAVEKQEKMRANWNKAVDSIFGKGLKKGLLSKEQVSLFNETLLAGDALGKVFTSDELQERGFTPEMEKAYRRVRDLYDNAHRMLSAQRNKYGKEDMAYREGYVPHFFHAWRVLDDNGIITTYRSMREAVKEAEKLKRKDEGRNIRVAPALDRFEGRGQFDAVTVGDAQYLQVLKGVQEGLEMTSQEARDLLEGVVKRKNRSRMFKNAWERKGIAGFEQNMEYALRHYLNLSARYIAMDTLKHDGINMFERAFGRYDNDYDGLAKYTKNYINDVLGVPSDVEEALNKWVRNSWLGQYLPDVIGDRPATIAASKIAGLVAHAKLGFLNLSSALMNVTQLVGTQAIIGPTWVARGIKEYVRPNAVTRALYDEAGIEENITAENPSGYSKVHQARGLLGNTSMAAFRMVDGMARKVTLIGAYRKARHDGKSHEAALEYAKKVNDDVNFDYSVADTPAFMRRTGPLGTVLFQFKKFPVKMMELALPGVGKLKGWEQARFWAPMLALSGMLGVPGFDWLKDWIKTIFGKDIELEVKKLVAESSLPDPVKRTILYGALSNVGIDVGRRVGMGDFFPSELKDLTGPAAATIARMVESLPKVFDDGNFMDLIEGVSPGLANPIKAFMGESRDRRRDRVAFKYETTGERIARATGARPIREAIENDAERIARYEQQKRTAAETDAIDDYLRARSNPESKAFKDAERRIRELRISGKRIAAELKRRWSPDGKGSSKFERALRGARTPRRYEDFKTMENYASMGE